VEILSCRRFPDCCDDTAARWMCCHDDHIARGFHGKTDNWATGGLITRSRGDELLILDTVKHQIHQLNRSATFIWGWMSVGG